VSARVDGQRLPAGFQRTADFVCTVDGDARKRRTITLDVRSGPMPKLLTPALDFEQVEEGKSVERLLQLTNEGSVPLRIKRVGAEGSPQLRVPEDYAQRVVRYRETLSIRVVWQ